MVEIVEIPLGENPQLHNEHDYLDFEMLINNPWIFDINIPTDDDSAVVSIDVLFNDIELENY
ncbi:hypothetical protein AKG34_11545 [Peribacillus butanolivorans]|uniref:hypothetical protein n=1 Tax=Peribacillus butanolivorans TaxID=421767 RepID=UPI0006A6E7A5|nr:hypothetical protein [Peribacillus butanolivorans]KON69330.1 hypothetical protein AKG34_11545 [Peribacillus butanolivorans]